LVSLFPGLGRGRSSRNSLGAIDDYKSARMIYLCTSKLFPATQAFKQAVIQTIKQIEDILTKKKIYIYIRVHPRLQFRVFLGFLKKNI
jgi:hypothetical protein